MSPIVSRISVMFFKFFVAKKNVESRARYRGVVFIIGHGEGDVVEEIKNNNIARSRYI